MRSASVFWIPATALFACLSLLLFLSGLSVVQLEAIGTVTNLVVAVAACAGGVVAFAGVDAWKKQKVWEQDFAAAKRAIQALDTYQEKLNRIRTYQWRDLPSEHSEGGSAHDGRLAEDQCRQKAEALKRCLPRMVRIRHDLRNELSEGLLLWGAEFSSVVGSIDPLEKELMEALVGKFHALRPDQEPVETGTGSLDRSSRRAVLLEEYSADIDSFGNDLKAAISRIRDGYLRSKLGRKGAPQ
ncbi:hypothetical protein SAMN06297129_0757 [Pseudooceanicola antarcticus]|uniref:Uncharacterized protein n=1 Tax=Pseudooceanicola antarcticus TaxID=1247613 RepID=A0A285I0S7_9RHOB|nr:hypothetical protein [Pseudooceanicola antarcticus]SNY40656.1 hypothetical protein SAMN06297129_0757 [Pseudooceanicola antarcticus]